MRLDPLTMDNAATGLFCARGEAGPRMIAQQTAWLGAGVAHGQLAIGDDGQPVGFAVYYPAEVAPLEMTGRNLYAVQCFNVRREQSGKGIGTALLRAMIDDARANGVGGLAVEGFALPPSASGFELMPRVFFASAGFDEAATRGPGSLLWLRLRPDAAPPAYLTPTFSPPLQPDRLRVDLLNCARCWGDIANTDLVRRVAATYGDRIEIVEHDHNHRRAIEEKGVVTGVFFDGERVLVDLVEMLQEEAVRVEIERRLREKGLLS